MPLTPPNSPKTEKRVEEENLEQSVEENLKQDDNSEPSSEKKSEEQLDPPHNTQAKNENTFFNSKIKLIPCQGHFHTLELKGNALIFGTISGSPEIMTLLALSLLFEDSEFDLEDLCDTNANDSSQSDEEKDEDSEENLPHFNLM